MGVIPAMETPIEYIWNASREIELFKSYVDGIEEQLVAQAAKLHDEKNIIDNTYDIVHGKAIKVVDGMSDQEWDLSMIFDKYFPNIQRSSAFISIYSFLEDVLNNLCLRLYEARALSLQLMDLHGKGIDRARLYLVKVASIDFCSLEGIWEEIKNIQKLRNVIVHRKGKIEQGKNSLRKYVSDSSHFELDKDDFISLKKTFLPYFLNQVADFYGLLYKKLKNA